MRCADIIRCGKGRTGAWSIVPAGPTGRVALQHYSTPMLSWWPGETGAAAEPNFLSLGWGSVSDQNGVNTACRVLGLPYHYSRDQRGGGPRITELRRHPCGHVADPALTACCDEVPAALAA